MSRQFQVGDKLVFHESACKAIDNLQKGIRDNAAFEVMRIRPDPLQLICRVTLRPGHKELHPSWITWVDGGYTIHVSNYANYFELLEPEIPIKFPTGDRLSLIEE